MLGLLETLHIPAPLPAQDIWKHGIPDSSSLKKDPEEKALKGDILESEGSPSSWQFDLDAAVNNTDALELVARRLEQVVPDVRSQHTDAMIDLFLVDEGCEHVPEHLAMLGDSPWMKNNPRRVFFEERMKGPNSICRSIALKIFIKKMYEKSSLPFSQIAADALEAFSLIRLINDFMSDVLLTSRLLSEEASPPWETMMIQRLPPKAAPFQAHDSEDMRNALSHFHCPHTFFFELFRSVQREAFVLDHDIIELSGYESSVSADTDSDAEESELGPAPDLAPNPVPELGPGPEVEPAPDPESRQSLTFVKVPDGPDPITVDDLNNTVIDLTQTVVSEPARAGGRKPKGAALTPPIPQLIFQSGFCHWSLFELLLRTNGEGWKIFRRLDDWRAARQELKK